MDKLIENDLLLAEFAKAIYRDIERDISKYEDKTIKGKSEKLDKKVG